MGKTGRWIRNILTGKKDRERDRETKNETDYHQISRNNDRPTTPLSTTQPTTPKEKRRWSFRRSSATAPAKQDLTSADTPPVMDHNIDNDVKRQALAAASAVIQLTAATSHNPSATEESAATKIQSAFRAYLARKALNALRGLVKLQALVRGHLVRKQATETLRCMQALVMVQARARAQRLKMAEEKYFMDQTQFNPRKSTQENRFRNSNQDYEENIKIVEMDLGDYKLVTKGRNSYSNHTQTQISTPTKQEYYHHISPSPSGMTDISPRTCSNHFEDYSYGGTAQSSPQCYSAISRRSEYAESLYSECPFYPNYMANTQSSRAKVRSHSAPKQRPAAETFEKQPTRRRPSIEGRNVPRAVRMQRSSSHVGSGSGSTPQSYHYPWSVKLDRSAVSQKDSDCGSNSTVVTQNNYCRSLVGFEVQGPRY